MREVIPHRVWTGNARDARNVVPLMEYEIAAVVDLAMEEKPCELPREIIYCRFPLLDGTGNSESSLTIAIETIANLIRCGLPVLVACSGGMSRSPAILSAAVSLTNGESPESCLAMIAARGPHDVSPVLWNEILNCLQKIRAGW